MMEVRHSLMTEPSELVAPDDSGSSTFARFKYQAHATFPHFFRLAHSEAVTEIYAEHIEDVAVRE